MDFNFAVSELFRERSNMIKNLGKKFTSSPILKHLIYVGILLIPLWLLPFTADVLELNKLVLLSIVAGAGLLFWLAALIGGSHFKILSKKAALGALVFGLAMIVSVLFSLNKDTSLFGLSGGYSSSLMGTVAAIALFFLIVGNNNLEKKVLVRLIVISVFAALFFGVLQLFGLHVLPLDIAKSKSFNTVGTMNALGSLGAITFPLFFTELGRKMKIVQIAAGALAVFMLVVLNWWVTWIPFLAGMLVLAGMRIKQNAEWGKLITLPLVVLVLGAALMFTGLNPLFGLRKSLPLEVAPSWQASYEIVRDAFSEEPQRLALGYGPESFRYVYDFHRPARISATLFSDLSFIDGTSELVNTIVHLGLVGLAAFIFLLLMISMVIVRNFKAGKDFVVLPAFVAALAAFIVYPLNVVLFAMFWIFLALVVMTYAKDGFELDLNSSNLYSALSSTVFTFVLIVVLAGLYFTATMLTADIYFKNAFAKADLVESVNGMIKAIDFNPRNQNYSRALSQTLLTAIDKELRSGRDQAQINTNVQRMMALSVESAKNATDKDPYDSQNWLNRGYVYENLLGFIDGADAWAVRSYVESLNRKPDDPFTYTRIGRVHLRKAGILTTLLNRVGKDDLQTQQVALQIQASLLEAEKNFKDALALNGTYGAAIYNLGAVYERQGRLSEAESQLEMYKDIRPNDAGLAFELGLLNYRLNGKSKAFSELRRAVSLFPDYSNARWYLALLHEERGELDEAIAHLERILELNPGHSMVVQKLDELKVGKTTIPPDEITDMEPLERR